MFKLSLSTEVYWLCRIATSPNRDDGIAREFDHKMRSRNDSRRSSGFFLPTATRNQIDRRFGEQNPAMGKPIG
jgi:hypothetical protein